jgi:hypothetical protein
MSKNEKINVFVGDFNFLCLSPASWAAGMSVVQSSDYK